MQNSFRTITVVALALFLTGCGLVYHPPREQGNLLEQQTIDQLHPGMTKSQVIALLGSPALKSPFDQDRWDYVRSITKRGGKQKTGHLSLFFDHDALAKTEGDLFSGNNKELLEQAKMYEKAGAGERNTGGRKGDKD